MNYKLCGGIIALLLLIISAVGASAAPGFDAQEATLAYLNTLQGADRERSDAYFEGGHWLLLWGALVAVLGEWIILSTGLSNKMRNLAERISKRRWLLPALYAVPYAIVSTFIVLPWTIYSGFVRERQYELMNLSFAGWFGEQMIALVVAIIGLAIFFMAFFAVIRRATSTWWVWGTGVTVLLLIVAIVIAPVFISPLFNEYTPMEDGPLRDQILSMAEKYNVPADNVYVFDQSKQHDRISANVSGLFGTMRISLNDNLLNRSTPEEVEAVMGHELGHYVLNHVFVTVVMLTLIFGFGFFLIAKLCPKILARYGEQWGIRGMDDPAVFPVFSMILSVYLLLATPVMKNMVRYFENEADAFGLEAARQPDGFAAVSMKLSQYRKIDPSAFEEFLLFDHPSGRTRVTRAMEWKAEHVENPQMVQP